MKRLFVLFTFMFSFVYGAVDCSIFTDKDERAECERMNIRESMYIPQTTKKNKNSFIGIEGGYGHLDVSKAIIGAANLRLFGIESKNKNFGYTIGVNFGWQKRLARRFSIRFTISARYARADNINWTTAESNQENFEKGNINNFTASYGIEGLIDFINKGDKRFGLSLGGEEYISTSFVNHKDAINYTGGFVLGIAPKVGFYFNAGNHFFDLGVNAQLGGLGWGNVASPTMVTIGYKYLFGE